MAEEKEDREGIRFHGRLGKERGDSITVELFIEGQDERIYMTDLNRWQDGQVGSQLVDAAFQEFVTIGMIGLGGFRARIKNPEHVAILEQAQRERGVTFDGAIMEERPWYLRTHRFLPARDFTRKNLKFILTSDKSDLRKEERAAWEKFQAGASLEEAEAARVRAARRPGSRSTGT